MHQLAVLAKETHKSHMSKVLCLSTPSRVFSQAFTNMRARAHAHMQRGQIVGVGIAFRARKGVKYLMVDHIDPSSSAASNGGVRNVSENDQQFSSKARAHESCCAFADSHTRTRIMQCVRRLRDAILVFFCFLAEQ